MTPGTWRSQPLDGGLHLFERRSGTNVLLRGGGLDRLERRAPRALQVGLLTPCNLSCSFCYRDTSAPSRLTREFLVDLLARCADWGVLEVAFGGGEPLLFRGFARLLRELSERTALGLNFTTNGTLLDDAFLAEAGDFVGEVRVSAYPDNGYRRTLRRLAGRAVGVNWLVTPANVGLVEPTVRDFVTLGARNVLLLGYKGEDPSPALGPRELDALRRAIARLPDVDLRLDVCWHPLLADVPQLFSRADCGAGDEFLTITPDRAVQPCSFHHERIPFETFDDLVRIHADLRARRPAARTGGCTRLLFPGRAREAQPAEPPRAWIWSAHASNNSGNFTIVGHFDSGEKAKEVAALLRRLARDHDAFVRSEEGKRWQVDHSTTEDPTPPLVAFGAAHGFEWDDAAYYDALGSRRQVITAGAIGRSVVVHHGYCTSFGGGPFERFLESQGAELAPGSPDDPTEMHGVVAEARSTSPDGLQSLQRFVETWEDEGPPPWGAVADDPRLGADEDRKATIDDLVEPTLDLLDGGRVRFEVVFDNPFAGAVALEGWMRRAGFVEVELRSALAGNGPKKRRRKA